MSILKTILLLFCFSRFIYSQNSNIYFDNLTTNEGLPDNYINCISQDSRGWIWIGTGMGISRFDGIKFKLYTFLTSDSIPKTDLIIRNIFESKEGKLFVCTEEYGLAVYNRNMDCFERLIVDNVPVLTGFSVKDITEDSVGNFWAATKKGICKIDLKNQDIRFYAHEENNDNSLINNYVRRLVFDSKSNLWIATKGGLDMFDPGAEKFIHYFRINPLLDDDITTIYPDKDNKLLVGTYLKGMVIINLDNGQISNFVPDPLNDRSYSVYAIHRDRENKIWIGTRGGLYVHDKENEIIFFANNNSNLESSLIHNSIMDITEDAKGDMWISTRNGLSYMVKEKQVFKNYIAVPNNSNYLNNSEVYSIWIDDSDNIWIGTENGGISILDREKKIFKYLTENNSGLSNNCIKVIKPYRKNKVLIGTYLGGVNIYDKNTSSIINYKHEKNNKTSISGNIVWDIEVDKKGQVWIATNIGLDRFDPVSQKFLHYPEFDSVKKGIRWIFIDEENDIWLGSDDTYVFRPDYGIINNFTDNLSEVFQDSKGKCWATSNKGILQYDKYKGVINNYDINSGIASNYTYSIQEDRYGKLWISTNNGLSCFNPETEKFRNYFSFDGLIDNKFHYGASFKSKTGELLFGSKKGLTILDPGNIIENKYRPPVFITDFKIFNKSVQIGNDNEAILNKSITESDYIEIDYKYNVISFEFAALNYVNSIANKYKYKLEGFDSEWIEAVDSRSVTYTNLKPGEYIFRVIASNNNGHWNEKGASKTLVVIPPYYMKFWFKSLVIISAFTAIFIVFIFIFKRRELRRMYELEKVKAQKLHELDSFKLNLFTNISHEIKTPLTLIISPLTKILKYNFLQPEIKEQLRLMEKNANHLMKLITQLLDYRKFQDGKLKIELKRGDIVAFCKNVFESFEALMNEKNIDYKFLSVQNKLITNFDSYKLRNILNNLISNAIKFNKKGGSINLYISMVIEQNKEVDTNESPYVKIEIQDTGVGIREQELPKIFNRYYNKTSHKEIESSGIGLAFTRELVELHKGEIFVESNEGIGTKFIVLLPFFDQAADVDDTDVNTIMDSKEFIKTDEFKIAKKNKRILLIIEDNIDVQKFINFHFKDDYVVLSAFNGKDGMDIALKTIPDIIISDIMMPGLDGKKLCRKIKKDERTSHIPVILLTALTSKDNEKDGLQHGADDYLTKPFDIDVLQTKVVNLLSMHNILKEKYTKMMMLQPSKVTYKTLDEKFIEKAIKLIEININDPSLNINTFTREMGVSRMQLYRKMDALTNMTVKEFVNDIRLKRAGQILAEKKANISEVAYSVGFNDLSYFGKCFKRKYGISPSGYNQKHIN